MCIYVYIYTHLTDSDSGLIDIKGENKRIDYFDNERNKTFKRAIQYVR